MNALNHSKFTTEKPVCQPSMAELIAADYAYYDAEYEAEERGEDISQNPGSTTHYLIMARSCATLLEVRQKLAWMTEQGTGLTGEEDAFKMMLEDLDRLMAQ